MCHANFVDKCTKVTKLYVNYWESLKTHQVSIPRVSTFFLCKSFLQVLEKVTMVNSYDSRLWRAFNPNNGLVDILLPFQGVLGTPFIDFRGFQERRVWLRVWVAFWKRSKFVFWICTGGFLRVKNYSDMDLFIPRNAVFQCFLMKNCKIELF